VEKCEKIRLICLPLPIFLAAPNPATPNLPPFLPKKDKQIKSIFVK